MDLVCTSGISSLHHFLISKINIMSQLHARLQQPGASLLSVLFTYGIAGQTFLQNVLQHLNFHDLENMRQAYGQLVPILRGHSMNITTRNANGGVRVLLNPFGQPWRVRSTMYWLGAQCYGRRFPSQNQCQITPQNYVRIAYCTGIPPPLDPNLRNNPCCRSVCNYCVVSVQRYLNAQEIALYQGSREAPLCRHCELVQVRRHPNGLSTCNCRKLLADGWQCWTCRGETLAQLQLKLGNRRGILADTHRDRRGRMVHKPGRRRKRYPPCPGCGRSLTNDQPGLARSVGYCLLCGGLEVTPTHGAGWQPTVTIPVQPTRRSARIANRYAQEPDMDFTPVRV